MDFGEEGIDVGEVQKNQREIIRVMLRSYRGYDICDVRTWVATADPPLPTKKGVAINPTLIPDLVSILQEAYSQYMAEKEGADETSS